MSVWVTLLSFSVSMTVGLFGYWGVWVLSVGGVCGWVFMSLVGREGECSEDTQPHTPLGRNDYVS